MHLASRTRAGCVLLILAVLAGVAELMIAVVTFAPVGTPAELAGQILTRAAVYTLAFVLIGLTWRGRRIARWTVLIMLGVLGTGSMVLPLITELVTGVGLAEALGAGTSPYFPPVRAAHIVLVITGSILLLTARRTEPAVTPAHPGVHAQPRLP